MEECIVSDSRRSEVVKEYRVGIPLVGAKLCIAAVTKQGGEGHDNTTVIIGKFI